MSTPKYPKPRAKIGDIVIFFLGNDCVHQSAIVNAQTIDDEELGIFWIYNDTLIEEGYTENISDDCILENLTTGEKFI